MLVQEGDNRKAQREAYRKTYSTQGLLPPVDRKRKKKKKKVLHDSLAHDDASPYRFGYKRLNISEDSGQTLFNEV